MIEIKKKKKSDKRNKGRDDGGIRILDTNFKITVINIFQRKWKNWRFIPENWNP